VGWLTAAQQLRLFHQTRTVTKNVVQVVREIRVALPTPHAARRGDRPHPDLGSPARSPKMDRVDRLVTLTEPARVGGRPPLLVDTTQARQGSALTMPRRLAIATAHAA